MVLKFDRLVRIYEYIFFTWIETVAKLHLRIVINMACPKCLQIGFIRKIPEKYVFTKRVTFDSTFKVP